MKTYILPIYRYAISKRFRIVNKATLNPWGSSISAKLLTIGFIVATSLITAVQGSASEVVSAGVIPSTEPNKVVNQYISRAGYMQLGAQQTTTTSNAWVSVTRRLSRGFSAGHTGLDVDGGFGDPIYAMSNGVIVEVTSSGPYGNKIIIQHGKELKTLYAHLQAVYVSVGQTVQTGELIGEMGSTGNSTGSHLHFEVYKNGQLIDPATFSYL